MRRNAAATCLLVLLASLSAGTGSQAADIDGAWASDPDACAKVFTKSGSRIVFAPKADLYGSGFIIAGNRIRGKIANCAVKVRKEDGDTVNLAATCSTDVAVETVQFTLKVIDENRISRVFHGIPELETPYFRCRP